jgi:hypothetical protein
MKLKEAKPKAKWIGKLEAELLESSQPLSELYGYLNAGDFKLKRE